MILPRLRCLSLLNQGGLLLTQLKQVHAQMIINGINCHQDSSTVGKLVEYFCAGSDREGVNYAGLIIKHSDESNPFIFNVLIRSMPPDEAIRLFADRILTGDLVFDKFTYIFVFGACARSTSSSALRVGKQIHSRILKLGFDSDVVVQTTSLNFYAKKEDSISARKVFDEMPVRSSATWNAMISGYCTKGKSIVHNAHEALMLFNRMLIENCAVRPTGTTMVVVLSACARLGILATGICVHGYINKTIAESDDDVFIGTGLVDMYSKCGCIGNALKVFERMLTKNVLTWSSMMAGLALHGQGNEAIELLSAMEAANLKPNEVTFTSLLFACCHTGLVQEGVYIFTNMRGKFGVEPKIQHYGCIVDLLGRAGRLEEAYEFIIGMPIEPDEILWRCLLSACKIQGNVEMGEKIGKILLWMRMEGGLTESVSKCEDFIALSNVYAEAERWEDVEVVRVMMRSKGIQANPGCSFVELK